jgi:hypothetical protein
VTQVAEPSESCEGILKIKLMAWNILLGASLCAVGWQIRGQWLTAQAVLASLNVPIKSVAVPPVSRSAPPEPVFAARYADVVRKDLFSKDRNATRIVDPPAVEIPKPMPPLPLIFGVMGLTSGTRAIMTERVGAPNTTVRAGETIGEFRIVALDFQNITIDWNGKQLTRKIDDLIDRSGAQTAPWGGHQAASQQISGSAAPLPPLPEIQAINNKPTSRDMGDEITATMRACKPDDSSAAGALIDGYRKSNVITPFGPLCRWTK